MSEKIGQRVFLPEVSGMAPFIETTDGDKFFRSQPHSEAVGKFGVIISHETVRIGRHAISVPVIRLDDGQELRGYECWWQPCKEDHK